MKVAPAGKMSVDGAAFKASVTELIKERQPKRIIETGTYLGTGTTKIIAEALEGDYQFITIEANPAFYTEAVQNLKGFPNVRVLNGYSIPKALMPTRAQLAETLAILDQHFDIYVDFQEHERIGCYMAEAGHAVCDDLLLVCIRYFGLKVDLMMLDSSGHLGFIEFQYAVNLLQSPCVFVLDDTKHFKHFQSLQMMKKDKRFTLLKESEEKFGFCIAEYRPNGEGVDAV